MVLSRVLSVVILAIFVSTPVLAKTKQEKDQELAVHKACTKECGDKFGTGMKGDTRKSDPDGYEGCMVQCNKAKLPAQAPAPAPDKKK